MDRVRRFRSRHSVDQVISGVMLRWEDSYRAWVLVDGQEILALIGSRPSPGQTLWFRVKQLYPEVVLQELHGKGEGGPVLPVHAQRFWALRARFEGLCRSLFPEGGGVLSPDQRKKQFFQAVAQDTKAGQSLRDLAEAVAGANLLLAGQGRCLLFAPWLMPLAHDQELVAASTSQQASDVSSDQDEMEGMREVVFGFTLNRLGRCELRLLAPRDQNRAHGNGPRFRLLLERLEQADAVLDQLRALDLPGSKAECLGTGPLPPHTPSALARLLPRETRGLSVGLNTRV